VVAALKRIGIPVLRWPGGCFADEYHWKDGIGAPAKRRVMVNTHWGGVVEDNRFGTHEFFDLCEQLGCEAYVCGNVGSGTVQEMMEWVEYITGDSRTPMGSLRKENGREEPWKLAWFGVGNESWGCGGNMRAEYYADLYRRYNTFVKNHPGQKIGRIAGGANSDDYHWTEVLASVAGRQMDGLSLHYYTIPSGDFSRKGAATGFDEEAWHATLWQTLRMEELVSRHGAIMDQYDPEKRIGMVVDEWGTWYDVEPGTNPGFLYQQNTLRDALVAALNLNIFHTHCERVKMANIAQTVNVLQAMILTDKEKIILTPTFHLFEMYKVHQGARLLPVKLDGPDYSLGGKMVPALHATASMDGSGGVHVSLVNLDPHNGTSVSVKLTWGQFTATSGYVLTAKAMDAHNTFENPELVTLRGFEGFEQKEGEIAVALPAKSVVTMSLH
jgi:alpha-N-arabinofuranosidase